MPSHRLYAGSYTSPLPHAPSAHGEGVYALEFDGEDGSLRLLGLAAAVEHPSFVAAHPTLPVLYVASELGEGYLHAFSLLEDGSLRELSREPTRGDSPAHVALDPGGRFALAVNYGGGAPLVAYRLYPDGNLGECLAAATYQGSGPMRERQDGPHPHGVRPSPDGRQFYLTDLGADQVVTYELAQDGKLRQAGRTALPPGSGPRHLAFTPDGRQALVSLELSSRVALLEREPASGILRLVAEIPAADPAFSGANYPAEVLVSPDGSFAYVSNRGEDSIAMIAVEPGALRVLGRVTSGGRTPRGCALSPGGRFLLAANQDSASITVFRRDEHSGLLAAVADCACPTPTSLAFL